MSKTKAEPVTEEKPEVVYPMAFVVEPVRLGRHYEIGSFEIVIEQGPWELPDAIARAIHQVARDYLLTEDFGVWVDMRRGLFEIDRGRFGRGTFRPADPDEEVQ